MWRRRSILSPCVVGRELEVALLHDALDGAAQGHGGVVFLVGEAGIGKSRLAQLTATDATHRALPVMRGRAVQTTTPMAYRPLSEALCSTVRVAAVRVDAELAPFKGTLGRLIPEWRDREAGADDSVVALAEAVLRFFRATAGDRGCLVVLEDLHWADAETLAIVEYLADNLTDERVLCLATVRSDDDSPGLDLARRLDARRVSQILELQSLTAGAVLEMVCSCLDVRTVAEPVLAFVDRAGGVPFLVEELLAAAVVSGTLVQDGESCRLPIALEPVVPFTFADSMRRRLAALGEESRRVLFAAAALGRRFDWELLPAMTQLDESAVLAALHSAVQAQIVATDAAVPAFRFRHALSRDAVLAQMLPPERSERSRRALDLIETSHPGLPGEWCELAADLAQAAGDRRRAAELLLEAGRRALRAGALASAERTLERALVVAPAEYPAVADFEECLVEVLSLSGKADRAEEVGCSLLAKLGDGEAAAARRGLARLRLAQAAAAATRWDEARAHLQGARWDAVDAGDERLACRVDALDALTALGQDDPQRAAPLARSALPVAERLTLPEVACQTLEVIGRCHRPYDLVAAEGAFERAYSIAEQHDLSVWRVRALHELGTIDLFRDGGVDRLEEARHLALDVGALATAAVLENQICGSLVLGDDPELALAAARRAAEIAGRYRLGQTLAIALGFQAMAHGRAGRRRAMEECLHAAQGPGRFCGSRGRARRRRQQHGRRGRMRPGHVCLRRGRPRGSAQTTRPARGTEPRAHTRVVGAAAGIGSVRRRRDCG